MKSILLFTGWREKVNVYCWWLFSREREKTSNYWKSPGKIIAISSIRDTRYWTMNNWKHFIRNYYHLNLANELLVLEQQLTLENKHWNTGMGDFNRSNQSLCLKYLKQESEPWADPFWISLYWNACHESRIPLFYLPPPTLLIPVVVKSLGVGEKKRLKNSNPSFESLTLNANLVTPEALASSLVTNKLLGLKEMTYAKCFSLTVFCQCPMFLL